MSDFLSRENDLIGGGGGADDFDFDAAASAFPDISLDGTGDLPLPSAPPAGLTVAPQLGASYSFDDFSTPPETATDVKVTGDDDLEKFEDQFPDIGVPEEPRTFASQPSFGATPTFAPRPQPSAFTATPILTQPLPDEDEPQVIKDWREKQAAEIKARDEASKAKRQETIAKAESAIDQFYEEYNARKEKTIRENKEEEAEYRASLTDSLSAGTTWSRISDLVELQNSQSKTLARTGAGTSDLSRFKEVLLRLKREGESAPGAAGY